MTGEVICTKVKRHPGLLAVLLLILCLAACSEIAIHNSWGPRYGKHSLSEWLEAWGTNLRFPDEKPPRSGLSDEEIDQALVAIGGRRACPWLLRWLQAEDSPLKTRLNRLLNRQHWIRFHFAPASYRQSIAETGFQYYGSYYASQTRSIQPALVKLTRSQDHRLRLCAYEAFFFTRPAREDFLPVARRALEELDTGIQAMAAQWLVERFPDEAEKAGMQKRFPQFYQDLPRSDSK